MGSFVGASTWRLRAFQLKADKEAGEKVDKAEFKRLVPLTKTTVKDDRSHCLSCGYNLQWYDLLPIISWVLLRGKCRQCKKPIGWFELLIELGVATFFVVSYLFWPHALTTAAALSEFILWLVAGVALALLFSYDAKWFLLPDIASYSLMVIGALLSILTIITSSHHLEQLLIVVGSVAALGGIYFFLYIISRGKWVGFGDVKLGVGLGLLLADWKLALLALFAANLIGVIVVIPGLIQGKLRSNSQVPFGPLLILGAIVAELWGMPLINFYVQHILFLS